MIEDPVVSVLLPTYRRPELLALAMDSLVRQTVPGFECLVLDDGGGVSLPAMPDERFRLMTSAENAGKSDALNRGLDLARAPWIMFLDDDDEYTPTRIEHSLRLTGSALINVCRIGELEKSEGSRRLRRGAVDQQLRTSSPNLGSTTVHRSICARFDPRYRACEDVEWWLRLPASEPVAVTNHADYLVRRHDGARHLNGLDARRHATHRLLCDHRQYFDRHRRAGAFRLRRLGLLHLGAGDLASARHALGASLRRWPSLRATYHLGRVAMLRHLPERHP